MTYTEGIFSANGYGGIGVTVIGINYGIRILASEGESRTAKALYTRAYVDDDFSINIIFGRWKDYQKFGSFMQLYGSKIASPDNTSVGPMRIMVPSRNFDKTGIPTTGVTFGDNVRGLTYPTTISFAAAPEITTKFSTFLLEEASANSANAPLYYPGGTQLSGDAKPADDVIYSYDQSYANTSDPAQAFQNIYKDLTPQS